MTKLDPAQIVALNEVRSASEEYRTAKARLQAELKVRLESEMDALRARRDRAAFRAFQLGVAKRRIGLEGLGTTDPKTHAAVIESGRALIGGTVDDPKSAPALIEAATPEREWLHPTNGKPFAVGSPFTVDDEPGVYRFTADASLEGGGLGNVLVARFTVDENGWPREVEGHGDVFQAMRLLWAPHPIGEALREELKAFVARAENS